GARQSLVDGGIQGGVSAGRAERRGRVLRGDRRGPAAEAGDRDGGSGSPGRLTVRGKFAPHPFSLIRCVAAARARPATQPGVRKMKNSRHALLAAAGIASVVAAAIGLSPGVFGASTPGYTVANVGAYGGEPSIVSDNSGRLYISTPSGGTITYRSTNHRTSWTQDTTT